MYEYGRPGAILWLDVRPSEWLLCSNSLQEDKLGKTHRGKGLKDQTRNGRTVCPVCKRTAVKVVYEVQVKEQTVKVCKTCKAAISHGKYAKELEAIAPAAPAAAPASEPTT